MTVLTAKARAALQAQQAEIAAQLAADHMATENERRAAELAKAQPLIGLVGGEDWNAHLAAVTAHRAGLPPELWSAAEHYLNTTKVFGDRFTAYVASLQPLTQVAPVPMPAQTPADTQTGGAEG